MPDYRLPILDQESREFASETFEADNDQVAWKHVRVWFTAAYTSELWCGARRVGLIGEPVGRGA